MKAMELKVWVDGVQRIVCGVTEFTTCQEVVIALAQAIGELKTTSYDMRECVQCPRLSCSQVLDARKRSNIRRI